MAAADHLHPNQLAMFMPAGEIQRTAAPWPADRQSVEYTGRDGGLRARREHPSELWERKADEAEWSGLTDDIAERGVERPVHLYHGRLSDGTGNFSSTTTDGIGPFHGQGHHRTAAAAAIDPKMEVPVIHHGRAMDALIGAWNGRENRDSWSDQHS